MDIRAIKTMMDEDIVTEVLEVQKDYYIVSLPICITETGDPQVGNFITKWIKFNDSDAPVKLYTRCIAGEAPAAEKSAQQYIHIVSSFRKEKAAAEGKADAQPSPEELTEFLGMIELGPNGKVH